MEKKYFLWLALLTLSFYARAQEGFPFANEIKRFKHQDSLNFPQPGGILFIGSSSIRLWTDLEDHFKGKPIIKRGVGGSELSQLVLYYTPYILFPYKPAKIFIYDGENDIAAGKTADDVYDNFVMLWNMIRQQLPDTKIYFLSMKLSPSRLRFSDEYIRGNKMISDFLSDKANGKFINLTTTLLNKQAQPDSTLFKPDYLHLNAGGYRKWEDILEPFL